MSIKQFRALAANSEAHSGAAPSPAQLRYLCRFGLLAPTSHNTVPQRFQILPSGELALWADRAYVLSASDPTGRQATVSCGCVIAHLRASAAAYGLRATCEYASPAPSVLPRVTGEARYSLLARLRFEHVDITYAVGEEDASEHANEDKTGPFALRAILARKMVRAEFDPRDELDAEAQAELSAIAARYQGLSLNLLSDPLTLMILGKFQELADTTVFNRESFARELGDWLLPNDDPSPLGMRGLEFGLSDDVARRLHRGLLGFERLLPDEVSGLAKSANAAMRSSPCVAVISARGDTFENRLDAGQAFAEMALAMVRRGWSTAMHAAITEVEAPNLALRGRLRVQARPTVVFRMGKPLRPTDGHRLHSTRPRLRDVLLTDPFDVRTP
ncbi:MAG: hypothetical protein QM784_20980 [Polyangiaceae bacterium]